MFHVHFILHFAYISWLGNCPQHNAEQHQLNCPLRDLFVWRFQCFILYYCFLWPMPHGPIYNIQGHKYTSLFALFVVWGPKLCINLSSCCIELLFMEMEIWNFVKLTIEFFYGFLGASGLCAPFFLSTCTLSCLELLLFIVSWSVFASDPLVLLNKISFEFLVCFCMWSLMRPSFLLQIWNCSHDEGNCIFSDCHTHIAFCE